MSFSREVVNLVESHSFLNYETDYTTSGVVPQSKPSSFRRKSGGGRSGERTCVLVTLWFFLFVTCVTQTVVLVTLFFVVCESLGFPRKTESEHPPRTEEESELPDILTTFREMTGTFRSTRGSVLTEVT